MRKITYFERQSGLVIVLKLYSRRLAQLLNRREPLFDRLLQPKLSLGEMVQCIIYNNLEVLRYRWNDITYLLWISKLPTAIGTKMSVKLKVV